MDPSVKNLREWVGLLFVLFCVLDIAGVQYGMHLVGTSPDHPDAVLGQVVALVHGPRHAWSYVYVTAGQSVTFYSILGASGVSLVATLGLLVINGIRQMRHEGRESATVSRSSSPARPRRPDRR